MQSFYFEVEIIRCGIDASVNIGLTQYDPSTRSGCQPGWPTRYGTKNHSLGIGYHSDNGGIYQDSPRALVSTETFTTGDVVGCLLSRITIGVLFRKEMIEVQFTKNGQKLLNPRKLENADWFPTIGMLSPGGFIVVVGSEKIDT